MRRTRLGDVTGAVTDVGDGGDLEGVPFLPPAPATRRSVHTASRQRAAW